MLFFTRHTLFKGTKRVKNIDRKNCYINLVCYINEEDIKIQHTDRYALGLSIIMDKYPI
ncbi:protein of unknown function [Methylocaldum szegediense]|uniref:Transposase n=1 Tax=Methylocaldum szegediense TaxID=73780 RepID=A0ABN8X1J0_9GAMM|nr:protein of unknown function [Methylocaldum szegediense]